MAVIKNGYRLIGNTQENASTSDFELYNLNQDPFELQGIVDKETKISAELKKELNPWYDDIMPSPNINDLPRITIGNEKEKKTILNRNEAREIQEIKDRGNIYVSWNVEIEAAGEYRVSCHFLNNVEQVGILYFRVGNKNVTLQNKETEVGELTLEKVALKSGKFKIDSWYSIGITSCLSPFYIERL
jgi:arylsulfatase